MKRLLIALTAVSALVLSAAPVLGYHGGDHDCPDFYSQADAQNYFRTMGGSPTNNVDDLDRDNDGVACEDHATYADASRDETPAGALTAPAPAAPAPPATMVNTAVDGTLSPLWVPAAVLASFIGAMLAVRRLRTPEF